MLVSPAVRAAAPRRVSLPTPFLSRPPSRLFASSSARSVGRSSRADGRTPARDKPSKIQTIPFRLPPENGQTHSETAAHGAFGVSFVFALLASRFLRRFGINFDTGVEQLALKPLLLPVWKVDLAMKGKALVDDTELNLTIKAIDASIPGFKLSPLDELVVSPPWDVDPVPFSPSEHSVQHGQEITILPFTRSPLNLLDKIAATPRTTAAKHGIVVNPARFKSVLFAAYPMYIPLYLGEYKLGDKRVTTVAFATKDGPAFAFYPQWADSPSWQPSDGGLDVEISGRPTLSDSDEPPRPGLLKELQARVPQLLEAFAEEGKKAGLEVDDPYGTEPFEGTIEELVEASPRAMGYLGNAARNREYIKAQVAVEGAMGMLEQVEAMSDHSRALFVGPGGPKLQDRETLLADLKPKYEQAKLVAKLLQPPWLKEIEGKEEEGRIKKWQGSGRGR
ncbi:hypothetical protein JCM1840_002583 [Sporobolomyces johnsonii]